jgi:hypothetical protein
MSRNAQHRAWRPYVRRHLHSECQLEWSFTSFCPSQPCPMNTERFSKTMVLALIDNPIACPDMVRPKKAQSLLSRHPQIVPTLSVIGRLTVLAQANERAWRSAVVGLAYRLPLRLLALRRDRAGGSWRLSG